jgi:UPF0755 protein
VKKRRGGCGRSLAILVVFAILFGVAGAFFFWRAITTPYKGFTEETTRVEVQRGRSTGAILRRLVDKGVLRDDFVPLIYLKTLRRGASLKAGVYEFREPLTPIEVIDKLQRGEVILKSVTIREGLDRFAVAEVMSAAGFGSVEEWKKVTAEPDLVRDLDPDADSLEGYLFPDTYKITPGTSVRSIASMMVDNFRKQFGSELAYIGTGLSVHETVTLASIVETEAQLPAERPVVASVYLNRREKKMRLQADPTVIYALKLAGRWNGNIRKDDLRMESPYNTYAVSGFPPGPIASPGLASLRAAAAPARTDYLYFVSRNDGSHVFARNLAEHNRNVNIHQRQFFRKQRAQQQQGQ